MNHKAAAARAARIVREVRAGMARADVARDHGVSRGHVTRICQRADISRADAMSDRHRAFAAKRANTARVVAEKISRGHKIKNIAKSLNLRTEYIYDALRENGISLRAIKQANGAYA